MNKAHTRRGMCPGCAGLPTAWQTIPISGMYRLHGTERLTSHPSIVMEMSHTGQTAADIKQRIRDCTAHAAVFEQ
jgi:hypothetical protein